MIAFHVRGTVSLVRAETQSCDCVRRWGKAFERSPAGTMCRFVLKGTEPPTRVLKLAEAIAFNSLERPRTGVVSRACNG